MTTDRKNFIFTARRGIIAKTEYPGVAQLVGRHIWDVEAARSSRATRTKKTSEIRRFQRFFSLFIAAQGLG